MGGVGGGGGGAGMRVRPRDAHQRGGVCVCGGWGLHRGRGLTGGVSGVSESRVWGYYTPHLRHFGFVEQYL